MNRIRVFLVLLASTLLIAGCAAQMPQPAPDDRNTLAPPGGGPCRAVTHPDRPIVCVDDSAEVLRVSPDPFRLHETPSPAGTAPTAVQWFTTSGRGDLKVIFQDERCVRNIVCRGNHCRATASKLDPGEKERRCKYDVQLTGHPDLDPDGILIGCCAAAEPEP